MAAEHGYLPNFISSWLALMFTYTIFIPNTWQRAAWVTAAMAAAPIALVLLTSYEHPLVGRTLEVQEGFVINVVLMMSLGFVTSVYGTHMIGALRREAFEAKQLGQYKLCRMIGAGGMGEVYLAEHQMMKRPCAIKLIKPELLGEGNREAAVERFQLEARTIAHLSSPNTVKLYDFGLSETGSFYFVMELLEGVDLFSLVKRFGPLPPERVVSVLRQACRSLAEAHAAGLLHRDIKPHNLLVCRLGLDFDVVKVLDFGLVKSLKTTDANLTEQGAVAGTPAYMPPERALGGAAEERSDLYSLGCVAYWMLTGTPVFTGEPTQLLLHHVRTAPKRPSDASGLALPASLEQIVLACLEKEPANRPASALDLWQRLGEVALEGPPWAQEEAERWWRENLPGLAVPASPGDSGPELSLYPLE
jgi:serine/threonine-protein kinase